MKKLRAVLIAAAVLALLPLPVLQMALLFFPVDRAAVAASLEPSTRFYDRRGLLLREIVNARGERCNPVALADISPALIGALLAAEDGAFRFHGGVNPGAALRAGIDNLRGGRIVSGASTITMQLARLLWNHRRDFRGKLRQSIDALRLEQAFSKDEILELYLNHVPAAPGCQGIEAASLRVTGHSSSGLGAAEAALLAGMIQAPSLYDPVTDNAAALRRRNWVLYRMKKGRFLSNKVYQAALAAPLPAQRPEAPVKAGHFTDYAAALGLRGDVRTSLDWELQEAAQNLAAAHAERFRENGLTNSAIVVIDNRSAEVLAMVGSKNWSADEQGYVNGALALRQPGSTLKPFAYALAFDSGLNAASLLADIETEYISSDRTLYIPRNYSRSFRGPVIAKEALAASLNIPAIRLVRDIGLDNFLAVLKNTGFNSLNQKADYYGLGLVLGNGEVSLMELAAAYSALARGGVYVPPKIFPDAVSAEGKRIFSEAAAWQITAILSDESLRVQSFGAHTPLIFDFPAAVKTGTSGNWRDSWTAGYTAEYTVAVWSGDFESVSMNQVSGSSGAGILFAGMFRFLTGFAPGPLSLPEEPADMRSLVVCAESGGFPRDFCPRKLTVALPAPVDAGLCAVHSLDGDPPGLAYQLPAEYDRWLQEKGKRVSGRSRRENPVDRDIRIFRPREGDIYIIEPGYNPARQRVEFAAVSDTRAAELIWYLDGKPLGKAAWPYGLSWQLAKGRHRLVARAGPHESEPVYFEVR